MTCEREPSGEAGLAALMEQMRPELLRFLAARCGDPDAAQDMMQDLWLKLADFNSGPIANGRAYLFRMANNLVLDQVRAHRRAKARDRKWIDRDGHPGAELLERPDPALPADDVLVAQEEIGVLDRAIADLPPGARRALQLYRLEGRKQSEIAAIMGISRSGVEKHLALAMRQLRNALDNCGFFEATASLSQHQYRGGGTRQDERT